MTEEVQEKEQVVDTKVVDMKGKSVDPEKIKEIIDQIQTCKKILMKVDDLSPVVLTVLGYSKKGKPFFLTNLKSLADINFYLDKAKFEVMEQASEISKNELA